MGSIKAWVKEPGKAPALVNMKNELEEFQRIVGGYIEVVTLCTDLAIICNEEGRLLNLPENIKLCGIAFCGPIIFVGVDGEEFSDCPILDYEDFSWIL